MLRRAIRRLKENTPERELLERELFLAEAGIRGEERLQKKFVEFYSSEPFEILWNTSLTLGNWPVQIDGLLLTSKVAVILESKNISGALHFENTTGEFFRNDANGMKTIMDNPAIQVDKHIRFIRMWFAENKIPLPVDGMLVFTALKAELCSLPQNTRTCRHHHMIEFLFKTIEEYPSSTQLNRHALKKYRKLIEKQLTPYTQKPIAVKYSLDPRLFKSGIYCETCKTFSVSRERRRWQCDACGKTSLTAGEEAVLDYFAIFGFQANNEKLRNFLNVDDRHIVKRLLSQEILTKDGSRRHSKYSLKEAEILKK